MPPDGTHRVRAVVAAVALNSAVMACVHLALQLRRPALRSAWFRVRAWEVPVWRRLGVRPFARLLDVSGWNRVVAAQRRFDGRRARLAALDHHTRRSELAHLLVAGVALAVAGAVGGARGRLIAVVTVALHLHPVLLQRIVRARIARVVEG